MIKIITLAPKEGEGYKFIKEIKLKTDIVLSIGHTAATFEQGVDTIDLGLSLMPRMRLRGCRPLIIVNWDQLVLF